jgi:hypothetical protein
VCELTVAVLLRARQELGNERASDIMSLVEHAGIASDRHMASGRTHRSRSTLAVRYCTKQRCTAESSCCQESKQTTNTTFRVSAPFRQLIARSARQVRNGLQIMQAVATATRDPGFLVVLSFLSPCCSAPGCACSTGSLPVPRCLQLNRIHSFSCCFV